MKKEKDPAEKKRKLYKQKIKNGLHCFHPWLSKEAQRIILCQKKSKENYSEFFERVIAEWKTMKNSN